MPRSSRLRYRGDTLGMTTRKMTQIMNSCSCRAPIQWMGSVSFKRSDDDPLVIENCMWDFPKLGNGTAPYLENLDQLLTEIYKELPLFVAQNDQLSCDYSQMSNDSEVVQDYFYKEMFWCSNEACEEVISWDSRVTKCHWCGMENDLSMCDIFSEPPEGKFLRLYPERFKPIFACLRNWFNESPTLKLIGLEVGLATYNFGARVRRQLKVFPHAFHQDHSDRFGVLNTGDSNKCLPVPDEFRYKGLQTENWYSELFEAKCVKNHVRFQDKNYLLGDEAIVFDNRSSAWF